MAFSLSQRTKDKPMCPRKRKDKLQSVKSVR